MPLAINALRGRHTDRYMHVPMCKCGQHMPGLTLKTIHIPLRMSTA